MPFERSTLYTTMYRHPTLSISMWYIYTMEYYSAIKRNEIGSFVEMQMDLVSVIQSEVSQKEKKIYHILVHIRGI